ncbi:uncharacterized protein JN550_005495 [Neoarthrinium moseri]|uniref:uncharacterized protein n=1 Tax=Neoarthrinium moseri TaxID=1658444 RepID=UPI001FDDC026|nr:uncharacterized protein JN550_005495 [Neoarthrinium moseri]KAI1869905.1 hypothetical protein JN550_005495 [Neoarthrinium moseri]
MLPPDVIGEIRNIPQMSFSKAFEMDFHGGIPGFESIESESRSDLLLQSVIRKQLTLSLSKMTAPLSQEAAFALSIHLGENPEWHEITIKDPLLSIVARLSSRIFLGEELCRDEDWLRVTKSYALSVFNAAPELRLWPRSLRKVVHWFLPHCTRVRALAKESRKIIGPVVQKRREIKRAALASGKPIPEFNDALQWAEEEAGQDFIPEVFQLSLSLVAIHTTTDLLDQCVLDIAQNPEIVAPLREEIRDVLRSQGWKKTSLYSMKLLDSCIKESSRMKPLSIVGMRRNVVDDVRLSNGLVLKKGTCTQMDLYRMRDPDFYENPNQWDGYRFFKKRLEPGKENLSQLVATSDDHLGFGHGIHACPGRFFAANEIKVTLCHMIMKYDWKLVPGTDFEPAMTGTRSNSNPAAQLLMRRRTNVEFDIDSI